MAEQQVQNTIEFYESLVSKFPTAESWAVNIFDATKRLTTPIAQTNFYRYLFDPNNYSFQNDVKTISEEEEEKYNKMVADFDKTNLLEVKTYKNGRDVKIVYSNKNYAEKIEPVVGLPETVQSQKQISQYETSNDSSREKIQIQEEKIDD